MARASKYCAERAERITAALREGNTRRAACDYAGISEDTFARWLVRYADFADAIKEAEGECERAMVATIQQATRGTWTAAAWWLERRRPDDWCKRERTEVTGKDGEELIIRVKYVERNPDPEAEPGSDARTP